MVGAAFRTVRDTVRGIGRALRARPGVFAATAVGILVLNLTLPVVVLSLARRPVDFFTFNPWLSRLPEWLASEEVPFGQKIEFLSRMALAWFSADNPVEGLEWGFIVDVPTLTWFLLAALLFGTYFALWYHRRDQVRAAAGWGPRASRQGAVAGAVSSVLGFTTVPCSVTGCGVPVLPVIGMAVTGVSTSTLRLFSDASRIGIIVVFVAVSVGIVYYGRLVGATPVRGPDGLPRKRARRAVSVLVVLTCASAAAPAHAGHEMPFYPSYYPQEITLKTLAPAAAAAEFAKGTLHAYLGADPFAGRPPPAGIQIVESLGGYVLVTFNPASAAMATPEARCEAARALVSGLAATPEWTPHPWPVTPYHPDYLHHVDLVDRAWSIPSRASTPLRLRVQGQLAAVLAGSRPTADLGPWDAVIEEVALADLIAAGSTRVNGWLGPPWVKHGWFHAYLLKGASVSDPTVKQRIEELYRRLLAGAGEPAHERAGLERALVSALGRGCERVVAGYTVRRDWINTDYSAGVENVGSDAHGGLNSEIFVRTVKLKDFPWNGWLTVGVPGRATAAWNPVAGFTDEAGRLLAHALLDPGLFPQPRGGSWTENRVRLPAVRTGTIPVPPDALVPEVGTGLLKKAGGGKTARAVITYRVFTSAFHDRTKMTAADALYGLAFASRWGAGKGDAAGHDPYVERATALARQWLVAAKVVGVKADVLRFGDVTMRYEIPEIEVYLSHVLPDALQLASVSPPWTGVPWHVLALLEEAVGRGLGAFSAEEARRRGVPWLDPVRDEGLKAKLAAMAAEFEAQGFVPAPLRGLVTPREATHRWALLRRFAIRHGHVLVTSGPYQLHAWSPAETVLRVFRDFSYPLGVGSYNAWAIPLRAYVTRVAVRGGHLTVHAEVERIERFGREHRIVREPLRSRSTDEGPVPVCHYVILAADGAVVGTGTVGPDRAGTFTVSVRRPRTGDPLTVVLALTVLDNHVAPPLKVVRVD